MRKSRLLKSCSRVFLLSLIFMFSGILLWGKSGQSGKYVQNPIYEATNSGIVHITRIDFDKTSTKLTVRTTFIPGWWVSFSDTAYLEIPGTGQKLYATGIEGTEFNKQTHMPDSGDSTFVISFPACSTQCEKDRFLRRKYPDMGYFP